MRFRSRLLLALAAAAVIPLAGFALGVRNQVRDQLATEYGRRVSSLSEEIAGELERRDRSIRERLATLSRRLPDDNRLRLAVQGAASERAYLLDWAESTMPLTGLSMLQLQDESGRILSSGHFRNEFDRLEPHLPRALRQAPNGLALVKARAPSGSFLALARVDSARVGERWLTIAGGERIDAEELRRLAGDRELSVALIAPDTTLSAADSSSTESALVRSIEIPYVLAAGRDSVRLVPARLEVSHARTLEQSLRRSVDAWFLGVAAAAAAVALLIAAWLADRTSRPIAELAEKTAGVELDRLDVDFRSDRDDEIGDLSRLLGAMTARLRTGTRKLREAERRATQGDMARQVNHDIKNGLIPIRNVLRHLVQVQRERPEQLPDVFGERQGTLESSVEYLETLARNYARLSPGIDHQRCDAGKVVDEVVRNARSGTAAEVVTRMSDGLPPAHADPLVLRRILENLVGNAMDSLQTPQGRVTVSVRTAQSSAGHTVVRLAIEDTGRGMTEEELARAFDDFYTTKQGGTGLGLSVVRRLVLDLDGALRVSTKPGEGTRFEIDIPATDGTRSSPAFRAPHSTPRIPQSPR